jgi:hypothetical protein
MSLKAVTQLCANYCCVIERDLVADLSLAGARTEMRDRVLEAPRPESFAQLRSQMAPAIVAA